MPFGRRRNRIDRSLREKGVPPEPQVREREVEQTQGPYDEADDPTDGRTRIDLGSVRLPVAGGMQLRVDVNQQQKVIGAILLHGSSLLQVAAFAAPRAGGIWDDVRADLARDASGKGGSLREVDGPFGPELAGHLRVTLPAQPGQGPVQARQAVRFLGVDGPRWFLRGTIRGPAAEDPAAAAELEEVFRGIVVVRGAAPMPVREQLPLTLPPQAAAQVAAQQAARQQAAGGPAGAPTAAPRTPPGASPQPPAPGAPPPA